MDPLLHTWPVSSSVMLWGSKTGRGTVLRLVHFTIGFCSLNFSLVAYLFPFSTEGPDGPFARAWVIGIATINLIPTSLVRGPNQRGTHTRALRTVGRSRNRLDTHHVHQP